MNYELWILLNLALDTEDKVLQSIFSQHIIVKVQERFLMPVDVNPPFFHQ